MVITDLVMDRVKRRHMALQVKPNAGHYALAALARKNPDFLCLSQNVDSKPLSTPPPNPKYH